MHGILSRNKIFLIQLFLFIFFPIHSFAQEKSKIIELSELELLLEEKTKHIEELNKKKKELSYLDFKRDRLGYFKSVEVRAVFCKKIEDFKNCAERNSEYFIKIDDGKYILTGEGIEKLGMEYSCIWGGCIAATFLLGPIFYLARVGEEYYTIDYGEFDEKMSEIERYNARIDSEIEKYKDTVGFDKINERIEELRGKIKGRND